MRDDLTYAECSDILDDFVRLGLCYIKHGKTQADDLYKVTDLGLWLVDTNRFLEYNKVPERRGELRRMFEEQKK